MVSTCLGSNNFSLNWSIVGSLFEERKYKSLFKLENIEHNYE